MQKILFGAVELGGTKTVALIAHDVEDIIAKKKFPTLNPKETVNDLEKFFKTQSAEIGESICAIGIGSFGPLDLNPQSKTFGYITSTPKRGWEFFNLKNEIESRLGVKVYLDTDVNAAALGEYFIHPINNVNNMVYITIGTGIGAGLIVNGKIVHGLVHPEFGHIRIPHEIRSDSFTGVCPYHKDCFEGLASGPALEARWGLDPINIPEEHMAWDLESEYIGHALVNLICTVSPELIVIGGGVMHHYSLYKKIRDKTKLLLNKYIRSRYLEDRIQEYIIPPRLKEDSGICGALSMAIHEERSRKAA